MSFLRRQFAVTKLEAVVIVIIVLLVIALLLPNVEQSRGDARRQQCRNNLKQIELALHQYHEVYGSFPPAVTYGPDGKRWHSWRTLLLPYFDPPETSLVDHYRLDEPWNSPTNLTVVAESQMPFVLRCPADESGVPERTTSYLAVVGDHTMWPPKGSMKLSGVEDGQDVTIHVVECVGSGIVWTEPRDLDVDEAGGSIKALGTGPQASVGDGPGRHTVQTHQHVSLVDGRAWYLPADTPSDVLRSMLLRNDRGPQEIP